ncbi:nitroreductase [Nocardioides zeae]|uniref:Nitroreductase n=1 Tax=Nocardioides imazamoxiresistens TaxID=3231893 RepID=A0ABU3PTX2_9ACTN|nr:nitroreductase [Nocardioides zeae]MDT9592683.1 nitroreductase [Nocardioides zeae]
MSEPTFDAVVAARHSCRAFLPEPVADEELLEVLALAQGAPSWCNTQPWQVHLVTGTATAAFAAYLSAAVHDEAPTPDLPGPERYEGVYRDRRRASGYALYASLGIERDDHARRGEQMLRNFSFFGAPHVLVVTTDPLQGVYGAVDCGGFVSTLMLAAASRGLGTCAQAAVAMYAAPVRRFLDVGEDRQVVCAIAIGRPDPDHPANGFRTERASSDEVVSVVTAPPGHVDAGRGPAGA